MVGPMTSKPTPPRTPLRPPFPPPKPGEPSKGAYALVRCCLGKDCPLPPIYRCPDCDWEVP